LTLRSRWLLGRADGILEDAGNEDERVDEVRCRVLVVDDEAQVRRSTAQLLELEGYQVEQAASGEEALQRFERGEAYSVVILDVVLPGLSGVETFARLRQLRPAQPVVIYSGYGVHDRAADLARSGAVFLGKPFTLDELLARVDQARGLQARV